MLLIPLKRAAASTSRRSTTEFLGDVWKRLRSRWMAGAALCSGALCVFALHRAATDKIVVGPFSVPKQYEERGYTSEAVSSAIVQFIRGNQATVTLKQPTQAITSNETDDSDGSFSEVEGISPYIDGKHVVSSFDQSSVPDIKVPLTSFTLESLIEVLRSGVGRQATRIGGEIVFVKEADSTDQKEDPQRTNVLIRYKIEYPEPSYSVLGYHWLSRRTTTITSTLTADGAEDVIQKLALVVAEGLKERVLPQEDCTESPAERLVRRANTYFGQQEYQKAARLYELANTKHENGHAHLALGVIHELEGNPEAARMEYEKAIKAPTEDDDDDAAWAKLYLGNLLFRHGHPSEAVKRYRALIELKTANRDTLQAQAAAYNNLGFVSLGQGSKDAQKYFEAARNMANNLRSMAWKCGFDDADGAVCGDSHDTTDKATRKAEALVSMDLSNQVLALSHYGLGRTLAKSSGLAFRAVDEKTASAIEEEYRESIYAYPKNAAPHYELARISRREHRYKQAIYELEQAIQIDPGFEQAYTEWRDIAGHWNRLPHRHKTDRPLTRTLALNYKTWGDALSRAGDPDDAGDRYCAASALDGAYSKLCRAQQVQ